MADTDPCPSSNVILSKPASLLPLFPSNAAILMFCGEVQEGKKDYW